MPRHLPRPHELLQVSEPCSAEWDSMTGDERVRFCAHCRKHVHSLSEFTPKEALGLVLRTGGRLCLSIERDARGLPRTRALAEPLYRIGRRVSRLAAGAFGAALTLCSTAAARAQTPRPEPAQQVATTHSDAALTEAQPAPAQVPDTQLTNLQITELPLQGRVERPKLRGLVVLAPREPLVAAAMNNDLEAVKRLLLFEGADVNVLDKNYGTTALAHAFVNGNREMMRELLWRGARVNTRLSYRQTALMRLGKTTPVEAVRDLLDAGAKVNLRDDDGDTALMSAAEQGRADVVELLLSAGAKVNARNKEGRTALMNAAAAGSADAVRLLLQAGADLALRDAEGRTALRHARESESDDAASLLLAYGAYKEPEEREP
ncbi:MAG TPA: ankyrin repeat domain-containing protein [Pyrinomonadaceae bacterium]|nr:ankyrin repeat domain-containing protein [Pyrinomonadaceae bacterium]